MNSVDWSKTSVFSRRSVISALQRSTGERRKIDAIYSQRNALQLEKRHAKGPPDESQALDSTCTYLQLQELGPRSQ